MWRELLLMYRCWFCKINELLERYPKKLVNNRGKGHKTTLVEWFGATVRKVLYVNVPKQKIGGKDCRRSLRIGF